MDHNIQALRNVLFIIIMRIHWLMQQSKMYNVVPGFRLTFYIKLYQYIISEKKLHIYL